MGLQVVLVDELPMEFWRNGVLKEVSHEMRFWEIADARNPVFFQTKCVPERRWSTSAVRRVRDGLVCGRIILGPWSDHSRTMVGSWSDRFRIVNGVSSVFRACAVDRIPLWFATVGSFPQCKWDCKWCWWMSCRWSFEGSLARNAFLRSRNVNGIASGAAGWVADGVLKEVSHEMRFWEIADARNPVFFQTKCVPERRWSTSAVRRVRDGLVCGRIILGPWSDHSRTMVGSWSDRFRIVNGVSSIFRACAVDRIPLWFATVGSFPQCKWDCKWCWWMSCRWSFEGSLARNAFLRDSRCTKPCVFSRQSASPNVDDLPLRCDGCETVSCVVGSFSDHGRIMVGSVPHCKWGFKCFSCMCGRQNSIVIYNCRIVPAM